MEGHEPGVAGGGAVVRRRRAGGGAGCRADARGNQPRSRSGPAADAPAADRVGRDRARAVPARGSALPIGNGDDQPGRVRSTRRRRSCRAGTPPRPIVGKTAPIAVVCEIRDAAATILRNKGYLAAVQVPPQTIEGGVVHFQVLMAKLVALHVRGDCGQRRKAVRRLSRAAQDRPPVQPLRGRALAAAGGRFAGVRRPPRAQARGNGAGRGRGRCDRHAHAGRALRQRPELRVARGRALVGAGAADGQRSARGSATARRSGSTTRSTRASRPWSRRATRSGRGRAGSASRAVTPMPGRGRRSAAAIRYARARRSRPASSAIR